MTRHASRCTAALLAALLGTISVPPGQAYAAAAATPSCSDGDLAAADTSGTPTSVKAGAAVIDSTRLTNKTAATLSNASFILALIPPSDHGGSGTPQLSWRVDGGAWHAFGLSWSAPSGSGPDWQSTVQFFGSSFAPGASHTLDIRTEFTTSSPSGEYQYDLAYSADPCGMNELGMNFEDSEYAQGWTQPNPHPSPTSHKTTASAPAVHNSTHASAAAATPSSSRLQTHAASPSPSPTGTPSANLTTASDATSSTVPQGTLSAAQPTAAARSNHTPTMIVAVLAALVLLAGGLYTGRRARRAMAKSDDE